MSKNENEITEEGAQILNNLSTYFWGIIFLFIVSAGMLVVHIALDFYFHVIEGQ